MAYLLVSRQFFCMLAKFLSLCGLAVICRFEDFPIKLHSTTVIMVDWSTTLVLALLGVFLGWFAMLAITGYAFIALTLFFSRNG